MSDLIGRLKQHFGEIPGNVCPGNIGHSRSLPQIFLESFDDPNPHFFEYFAHWDRSSNQKPLDIAIRLAETGMIETAWHLCQSHFDQTQKKESETDKRHHKGHPACGLALLGKSLNSPSLLRHYAMLSSVGDVYWEHVNQELKIGGLGPTLMESFESNSFHNCWRNSIREFMNSGIDADQPRHLEPFLLMRWFGRSHWERFLNATSQRDVGKPYTDVILGKLNEYDSADRGKLFEATTALLFSMTPGFEVRSSRRTSDEQVDLVVRYEADPISILRMPNGPGLIECKSSTAKISASELRDFGCKCLFHRVNFGILVANRGISGGDTDPLDSQQGELVRRRFLSDGLILLVLDRSSLSDRSRELRGLQEPLSDDYDLLVYGPEDG